MKLINVTVVLLILFSAGCTQNSMSSSSTTFLRIKNGAGADVEDLIIEKAHYGDIRDSRVSDYMEVNELWPTPFIKVMIKGEQKLYLPTDHVGEEPLPPGRYTATLFLYDQDGNKIPMIRIEK